MAVGMKQSMNLSQTLRMTPQLQQAIKLLQLLSAKSSKRIRFSKNLQKVLATSKRARNKRRPKAAKFRLKPIRIHKNKTNSIGNRISILSTSLRKAKAAVTKRS